MNLRRPPTVWITQIFLAIFAFLFVYVFLKSVITQSSIEASNLAGLVFLGMIFLGIAALLLVAFWGIARRKEYGRLLGALSLLCIWCLSNLGNLVRPSGPYGYYEYKNAAQLAGAIFAIVCFNVLFLYLIIRLLFSARVKAFFRKQQPTAIEPHG